MTSRTLNLRAVRDYGDWADTPIPALGDETPRQAVGSDQGRRAVITCSARTNIPNCAGSGTRGASPSISASCGSNSGSIEVEDEQTAGHRITLSYTYLYMNPCIN